MISVVIPAYKNTEQLVNNLRNNLKYLKDCEIIIINDDPEKSIREALREFPKVKLIENSKNLGFGGAVNAGVNSAKGELVVLLNSDVLLHNDSYKKALKHFSDDKTLFAVSFAQKEASGETVGKNRIYFGHGLVQHSKAKDITFGLNGWAEGGSSMFNRDLFLKLGGFDLLYAPFYWEDIDLSYNAWKSGYKILFDPAISVDHHHESTIGKYFDKNRVKRISYRNQLLFTWKNISQKNYCMQHALYLPVIKLQMLMKGEMAFLAGLWQATLKLPQAIKSRLEVKKNWKIRDEEIFNHFK